MNKEYEKKYHGPNLLVEFIKKKKKNKKLTVKTVDNGDVIISLNP